MIAPANRPFGSTSEPAQPPAQPLTVNFHLNIPDGLVTMLAQLLSRATVPPDLHDSWTNSTAESHRKTPVQSGGQSAETHTRPDSQAFENTGETSERYRITNPVPFRGQTSENTGERTPRAKSDPAAVLALDVMPGLLAQWGKKSGDHRSQVAKTESCFSEWLGRPAVVADLTQDVLNEYLGALKLAAATINKRKRYLKAILKHCFGKSAAASIDLNALREPKHMPVAFTLAQVETLIAACHACTRTVRCDGQTVSVGLRTLLVLRLIYDTGVRISALMALPRSAVADGFLIVPAEVQKTDKEQRFALSAETLELLQRMPLVRDRLIPHTYEQERIDKPMRNQLTQILKDAGLPTSPKHKWHCLRRTHATQLAANSSMDVAQRALGHSSVKTTERYVDRTQLPQVHASEIMPRLNGSASVAE